MKIISKNFTGPIEKLKHCFDCKTLFSYNYQDVEEKKDGHSNFYITYDRLDEELGNPYGIPIEEVTTHTTAHLKCPVCDRVHTWHVRTERRKKRSTHRQVAQNG